MKTDFLLELREKFETCQKHPFIRNYAKVVKKRYFTGPQIAEIICLPDENGHRVAILKTHWLRQIQRKWKRIYQERKRIISLRMRLSELRLYEITGKGSKECSYLPGII
jgi:hypothetical protein